MTTTINSSDIFALYDLDSLQYVFECIGLPDQADIDRAQTESDAYPPEVLYDLIDNNLFPHDLCDDKRTWLECLALALVLVAAKIIPWLDHQPKAWPLALECMLTSKQSLHIWWAMCDALGWN